MRWLIYVITVFLINSLLVIGYWRDNSIDLTLSSIVFFILLLPIFLIGLTFLTVLSYKKITLIQQKNEPVNQQLSIVGNNESKEPIAEKTLNGFKVYATALQSSEGSDVVEIIEALKNYSAAKLDPELVGADGVSLITRRIDLDNSELDSIDHILNNTVQSLEYHDDVIKRIIMIYQRLFNSLSFELAHLSQGMAQFNSWRIQPAKTSNTLHPAWADSNIKNPEITDMVANMQQWPIALRICNFISDRFSEEQYDLIHDYICETILGLGFNNQNFTLNTYYTSADNSQQQLDIIQQQAKNTPNTVFLVVGADSDIDQDYIEELTWTTNHYIAAELGYAIVLAHDQVTIPELKPVNYLSDAFIQSFNLADYKLNKCYQGNIEQLLNQWLATKKITVNERTHFISNIHPSLDYKELPLLNLLANNLNIVPEQIVLTSTLLEHTNQQDVGFAWVLASALSKDLNGTTHILCLRSQQQLSFYLISDEPDGIINSDYSVKTSNNASSVNAMRSNHLKVGNYDAA